VPPIESRKIGLARALSKLGYCSRSQAGLLIRAGRVKLNDITARDPETPVRIEHDQIAVDGSAVKAAENIYLVMNKPRGLVTTASDEKGRDTVYSLLSEGEKPLPWIAPVGRLDKASEGLLLLSNDSQWAARISAPESHLPKTYHVQIDTIATEELIGEVVSGVKSEGDVLRAVECRLLRTGEKNSWLEIALEEGKNRQIRRMLSVLGLEVLRLVRVSIGPLQLGTLAKGAYRHLTAEEKNALDLSMNKSSPEA
jgi:23S rRNA pseudouridine2605 synthase